MSTDWNRRQELVDPIDKDNEDLKLKMKLRDIEVKRVIHEEL
jgi:hypothetical protein